MKEIVLVLVLVHRREDCSFHAIYRFQTCFKPAENKAHSLFSSAAEFPDHFCVEGTQVA